MVVFLFLCRGETDYDNKLSGDYYDQYSPVDDAAVDAPLAEEDAFQDFVVRNEEQQTHGSK